MAVAAVAVADGEITTFQPLLFWEKLLIHLKLWDYIIFLLILKTLLNHVIQIFIEMDPVYLNVVIILLLFVNQTDKIFCFIGTFNH